jgi:hypothetical protein
MINLFVANILFKVALNTIKQQTQFLYNSHFDQHRCLV